MFHEIHFNGYFRNNFETMDHANNYKGIYQGNELKNYKGMHQENMHIILFPALKV